MSTYCTYNLPCRLLVAVLVWLAASSQLASAQSYSNVIVFGDSLSDNGNLAASGTPAAAIISAAPYNKGRITNGLTAVEILSRTLGLSLLPAAAGGTNFAVAGASARGKSPIDLTAQVETFLTAAGDKPPENALYIIFIGGNDVRKARDGGEKFGRVITNRAITRIYRATNALIQAGAKNILISNTPDIGTIPETRLRQVAGEKGLVRKARALSERFKTNLERIVARLESEHEIDIAVFDLYTFSQYLNDNAESFGLTNRTSACFIQTTDGPVFRDDCDFTKFAFFDPVHPTSTGHDRIARAMYSIVPANTIPTPAD